jgi:hypothetical protein
MFSGCAVWKAGRRWLNDKYRLQNAQETSRLCMPRNGSGVHAHMAAERSVPVRGGAGKDPPRP